MFSIRDTAILIALAAAAPALAQTPADLQRRTGIANSRTAAPSAPLAQSFSAQDLARLTGAPAGRSSAPRVQPSTAFGAQDLARLMNLPAITGRSAPESISTASAIR